MTFRQIAELFGKTPQMFRDAARRLNDPEIERKVESSAPRRPTELTDDEAEKVIAEAFAPGAGRLFRDAMKWRRSRHNGVTLGHVKVAAMQKTVQQARDILSGLEDTISEAREGVSPGSLEVPAITDNGAESRQSVAEIMSLIQRIAILTDTDFEKSKRHFATHLVYSLLASSGTLTMSELDKVNAGSPDDKIEHIVWAGYADEAEAILDTTASSIAKTLTQGVQ